MKHLRPLLFMIVGFAFTLAVWGLFGPVPVEWPSLSALPLVRLPGPAAKIGDTRGVVQASSRNGWRDLAREETVYVGDVLRVGAGSSARIMQGAAALRVASNAEVRFETASATTLLVGTARPEGSAEVRVSLGGGRTLRMSGDVVVRLAADGAASIENRGGVATLDSAGKEEVISVGQRGALLAGATAADISPLPVVAAAVRLPQLPKVAVGETLVITGTIEPGQDVDAVIVGGLVAELLPDGTFRAEVPLTPGENKISIVTRDVFGKETVYQAKQVLRATADQIRKLRFDWNKADEKVIPAWGAP